MIIIEGNGWGNNYNGMLPPWDKNMVLSFHKYWNFNTDKEIKRMLDAREQYNVPVWLGETGENSNVWFTEAIILLEKHNIGWAWWPAKKMGLGNPLEIPANHNFMQIADFFNGTGKETKRKRRLQRNYGSGGVFKTGKLHFSSRCNRCNVQAGAI